MPHRRRPIAPPLGRAHCPCPASPWKHILGPSLTTSVCPGAALRVKETAHADHPGASSWRVARARQTPARFPAVLKERRRRDRFGTAASASRVQRRGPHGHSHHSTSTRWRRARRAPRESAARPCTAAIISSSQTGRLRLKEMKRSVLKDVRLMSKPVRSLMICQNIVRYLLFVLFCF